MIARIVDGGDTDRLLLHLVTTGDRPVLIAHSHTTWLDDRWWDDEPWYRLYDNDAHNLAYDMDEPMQWLLSTQRVPLPRGTARRYAPDLGRVVTVRDQPNHVWYCTLTLHPDEPAADRQTWREIVMDLMSDMGMSGNPAEPDYAWVAVHNGHAPNGSDRLHVVANTVREDGRRWSRWRDQYRVQQACNTLEHRYGLYVVPGREERARHQEQA